MSKFFAEVVQDFDRSYYTNLTVDGKLVEGIKENVSYKELWQSVKDITGICLPPHKDLIFQQFGRKKYAYIDATQPCARGCIVTLNEIKAGHRPNWR